MPLALAFLAVPLVVAVVALRTSGWHAGNDLALVEMRVRDVLAGDPPLVGLSGRIEHEGVRGSHPGPISFWLLAPVYWAFGRSSWALQVSSAALDVAAVATTLWLAWRRAGRWGVGGATAGVAVLLHAAGPERWTTPWNPYVPVLWWPVLLLAVWSVLCRDRAMVVVAVVAGSICAQTHVSYVGLVGALGALTLAGLAEQAVADRRDAASLRRIAAWSAAAAVLLVLLWAPPLLDQARNTPGNLSVIGGQFTHPSDPQIGWRRGLEVWSASSNPAALAAGRPSGGPSWPGALLVTAWAFTAWTAWRHRWDRLVRLHAVVAVALVAGAVSIARIQGRVFDYLLLWSWGTVAVLLVAMGATAAAAVAARPRAVPRVARAGTWLLAAIVVLAFVPTVWAAAHAEPPLPDQSSLHGELLPATIAALTDRAGSGHERYLVRSDEPFMAGLNTYTLLLELERHGFDAGVDPGFTVDVRPSRVVVPEDATATLTYVAGAPAIERWRARPEAVELAHAAPPADETTAAPEDLVRSELRRAGLDELATTWDGNMLALTLDTRIPDETLQRIADHLEAAHPTSVFLTAHG